MNTQTIDAIEISPEGPVNGTVIWLHGLGADGHDFEPLIRQWDLTSRYGIRFVLPHAPVRPVTLNGGMAMRAWYDIASSSLDQAEDEAGLRASQQQLEALIQRERDRGVPASAIVLAGFSQGGAVVLQTGLRYLEPLAGMLALSCYLPLASTVEKEMNPLQRNTPIRMDHGDSDPVVPLALARQSLEALRQLGFSVEFNLYSMPHSLCPEQVESLYNWLRERIRTTRNGS